MADQPGPDDAETNTAVPPDAGLDRSLDPELYAEPARTPAPAEEMDHVCTDDEKAARAADAEKAVTPSEESVAGAAAGTEAPAARAGARGTTATATKPARPKTGAAGNKTATGRPRVAPAGRGKQTLTTVGSGVKRVRTLLASLIWLVAVLAAAVLALGALFTALDQTNQSNAIVEWVLARGHDLVGPFKDLFRLETAKNTLLVNWGIAALVYLIGGKIVERFVRP